MICKGGYILRNFFAPKSIAVIGASHNKKKLGFLVYENLKKYGYKGDLYGVNIKGGSINGARLYKNISEINRPVDLAVIVVPAEAVLSVIDDCGRKGISSAIIISAGFSEIGARGKALEKRLGNIAEKYGIRILGPNCLGIIDTWAKMNASFAESMPDRMKISLFSQSGAICSAILDWANAREIGFSRFISLGNKADIDENEILEYLALDDKTNVVLAYLESINDGQKFMERARALSLKKPFIAVKSGVTKEGAKTVSSHTGNIAGSDLVADVALRQSGVIRARSLEDLFDLARIFAFSPEIKGRKIAVITNAGGPGVMLADAISKSNLTLAKLSEKTHNVLMEHLPAEANIHNPIDVLGDALADRYKLALEEALKDENVDGAIAILTPQVMTEIEKTAKAIIQMKKFGKPIAACFLGGEMIEPGRILLEERKIPFFEFPERAVMALEALSGYWAFRRKNKDIGENFEYHKLTVKEHLQSAITGGKKKITEEKAFGILKACGIETVNCEHGVGFSKLARRAKGVGYPVVLKTAAEGILHKTEVGGVVTGIRNEGELQKAYFSIRDKVRKAGYENFDKMDIYRMEEDGLEIFLGAKRDPNFGPMIVFGMGGVMVETLKDFSYRIGIVGAKEAREMIDEIKSAKLFHGFRGMPEVNIAKMAKSIVALSHLMHDFPEIKEIDINPLKVTDKKCVAVDGKIIWTF